MSEERKEIKSLNCSEHLANERTFLAWIRTSIGIMALGFVIERFALFLRQIIYLLDKQGVHENLHLPSTSPGYSFILGIFLVGIGSLIGVFAFIKYKQVEKQIDQYNYRPSALLDVMLALLVLLVGLFLVVYLIHTI